MDVVILLVMASVAAVGFFMKEASQASQSNKHQLALVELSRELTELRTSLPDEKKARAA
jgi:hypothetical protein